MKTMFIGYHNLKTEARSMDMLELLKLYGETTAVSYGASFDNSGVKSIANPNGKKGIIRFMFNALKTIFSVKPDIVILHDDYPLMYVSLIRCFFPKTIIIHDSSELYLVNEKNHVNTWKKKIAHVLRYVELKNTKKVDVVIAANMERATIMKEYFSLKKLPLVFENIHKIETEYNRDECQRKYGHLFEQEVFTAIYAGGVAEERLTFKMAEQIGRLGSKYQLIILGAAEVGGEEKLNRLISDNKIGNVHYLGFVTREELKYLMEKSDVSISAFAMDVVNNINCASGKVFEGLFLGKPLLAGENPSLKSMCEKYGIGISTTSFDKGLQEIENNYDSYVSNVEKYITDIDYCHRIQKLKHSIDAEIKCLGKEGSL